MGNTPVRGTAQISNNVINTYRPARIEEVNPGGARPVPTHVMQAPKPLNQPEQLQLKWNQQRPFKQNIQKQDPTWNRPFIRNAPPYIQPNPGRPGMQPSPVRPNVQPNPGRQPNPPVMRQPNIQRFQPARPGQPARAPGNNPVKRRQ